jgi:spermidine synthase
MLEGNWKFFILQEGEIVAYEIMRILAQRQTKYQYAEILETKTWGKCLFLDQKPQSSIEEHFIYNEALVHPAMVTNPNPRKLFIAGGGPGSGLHEMLRYNTVEEVVFCDLDTEAIELYREYLPEWHEGAFDDPRVRYIYSDAREYLANSTETFDCIWADISDPLEGSPAVKLFTAEFYEIVKARLGEGGIFVTQAGRTNLNNLEYHKAIYRTCSEVFPAVSPYSVHIPFFGESWGFVLASLGRQPKELSASEIDQIMEERGASGTRFYDGTTNLALFALPRVYRQAMASANTVIRDAAPLYVK